MSKFVANEDQCYDRAYETFLRFTDLHQTVKNCFSTNLPKALQQLHMLDTKSMNILSVGAGSGDMDKMILDVVMENVKPTNIVNRAVEPHSGSVEKYKDMLKNQTADQNIDFQFENKSFDEYASSNDHAKNQFDLIQSVHSFYFVKDVQASLQHCFESELTDKGLIMLLAGNEDRNIFRKVYTYLAKYQEPGSSAVRYMGSKGFVEVAERCQYKYKVFPCLYTIDISEIFHHKEDSKIGNLLLDFFTFEQNFSQRFEKEVVNGVCDILKSSAKKGKDGRLIIENLDELVVVYKPSTEYNSNI